MRESVHHFFYYLTRELTLIVPRLFSRHWHEGMENVPRTGAALLLSNHISHFDPSYMGVRFPRYIHFMADKPLLEIPIFGKWLEYGYVFPIDRTKTDIQAIKTALKRLKEGNIVGHFPRGRHSAGRALRAGRSGNADQHHFALEKDRRSRHPDGHPGQRPVVRVAALVA